MIKPYLFFDERCEEAIAFYERALGAERVMVMRYRDSPDPIPAGMTPKKGGDAILHACLKIGDDEIMLSDGPCTGEAAFNGFALSVPVVDEADARAKFAALGEGGKVRMPLGPTFFSPCFGMVADPFGVVWMMVLQP